MITLTHYLGVAAALIASASAAAACESAVDGWDDRIVVSADGSFENGNVSNNDPFGQVASLKKILKFNPTSARYKFNESGVDYASGFPVRDRGNGRVAQIIRLSSEGCAGDNTILFVDCTTADNVLLAGKMPTDDGQQIAGWYWTSAVEIQAPKGPISIGPNTTVTELVKTAKRHKIDYAEDIADLFGKVRKRDRYDIYLGCKIFYPDSVGATR